MSNKDKWLGSTGDAYYRRNAQDMGKGIDLVWPLCDGIECKRG